MRVEKAELPPVVARGPETAAAPPGRPARLGPTGGAGPEAQSTTGRGLLAPGPSRAVTTTGRGLAVEPAAVAVQAADAPFARFQVRAMTPGQMTDLSLELYVAGALTWDQHSLLSFQPELQPDFNRTIGALTGQWAEPNKPRDFVEHWNERLQFELRHRGADDPVIADTRRITQVLGQIDQPTNVVI